MGKHLHRLSNKDFETMMADCPTCGRVKFTVRNNATGNAYRCSNKRREEPDKYPARSPRNPNRLLLRYGLTRSEYSDLLDGQDGGCAVCHKTPDPDKRAMPVDHCHKTGKVRGILCHNCNTAAGLLGDSPGTARQLAAYLEAHA
jgi:hypothetical protein